MKLAALLLLALPATAPQWVRIVDVRDPVETLAAFIARYEGMASGGLIYVGQPGAHPGPRGYAWWETEEEAAEALRRDLRAKIARGMTAAEIVDVWCYPRCNYAHRLGETGLDIDRRWD